MKTYQHALGALLLLLWRWSGSVYDRFYGHPAQRLIAAMEGCDKQGGAVFLRARTWLFEQVMRLLPDEEEKDA